MKNLIIKLVGIITLPLFIGLMYFNIAPTQVKELILKPTQVKELILKPSKKCVLILPLNKGVDKKHMDSAVSMLKTNFPDINIVIGEKIKLPKNCFNGKRYRADSILLYLDKIKPDSVDKIIGLTSSDISSTRILFVHGKKILYKDRGIFGLGRRPGTVCVVSNYRTGNVETFAKTTTHEFMHTLGVPHCEHKYCIMQDGKGSGKNMRESNHIHKDCFDLAMKGFNSHM